MRSMWRLSPVERYKLAFIGALLLVIVLAMALIDQAHAGDRLRQACEERNHQHELQSALSGGAYTWPREDCH